MNVRRLSRDMSNGLLVKQYADYTRV
jgi:hypothetical protein